MIFTIVNRGKADIALKKAIDLGAMGGTILLGEGTVRSKLLAGLGLTKIEKELLMIHGTREFSEKYHRYVKENIRFYKRNRGIAFSVPFVRWSKDSGLHRKRESYQVIDNNYTCISVIVDRGNAPSVMDAARKEGAHGGTFVHGHGAGVPTDYYFPIVVEPEKDVILLVAAKEKEIDIKKAITNELSLQQAGAGVIFSFPVIHASGLFEERFSERRGASHE